MPEDTPAETAAHDLMVADLSETALFGALRHIGTRPAYELRDPTQRWIAGRRAALLRRIKSERLG